MCNGKSGRGQEVRRGDIFYIDLGGGPLRRGSEQHGSRPALVVSNDMNNKYSDIIEIAYLTTRDKAKLPTHVDIDEAPMPSIALCEQIDSVDKFRLLNYIGHASEKEMEQVDVACAISLDLQDLEKKFRKYANAKIRAANERVKELEMQIEVLKKRGR